MSKSEILSILAVVFAGGNFFLNLHTKLQKRNKKSPNKSKRHNRR